MERTRETLRPDRPSVPGRTGPSKDRINDICYGIAIHVDEKADFPGENTPFALSVGDADGIDRFDAYRLHEMLNKDAFLEKTFEDKLEYVEKRLSRLHEYRELPVGTKTAGEMWRSRIDFYIEFYKKLADQLRQSKSVICD